jgi:hypothetical protein
MLIERNCHCKHQDFKPRAAPAEQQRSVSIPYHIPYPCSLHSFLFLIEISSTVFLLLCTLRRLFPEAFKQSQKHWEYIKSNDLRKRRGFYSISPLGNYLKENPNRTAAEPAE